MRHDNSLFSVIDNISERLRVLDAIKEGTQDPVARFEIVVEEGAYLKVLMMVREAQLMRDSYVSA